MLLLNKELESISDSSILCLVLSLALCCDMVDLVLEARSAELFGAEGNGIPSMRTGELFAVPRIEFLGSVLIRRTVRTEWKNKSAEERHLERKQELELARIEARRKTENETRIRETRHKEEIDARLRAEEETRLKAEE
ncbi:hypothetical protein TNCV_3525681 [Trichonephila clavipes]|uniref:Uncharacterized protein n=1 Tax=Trichonephila clavipes TaxID=2585209 RepID=A0A8X6V6J1_TRICX|nr:hypothetical protein TNCV_3525681 [Trichonephila clavipes]